jgi:hypothetical protein
MFDQIAEDVIPRMDTSFLQDRGDELAQGMAQPSICDSCVSNRLCADLRRACVEFTQFVEAIPGSVLPEKLQAVAEEMLKDGSKRVPTRAIYLEHFVL